jgi:hypothetical protein
MKKLLNKTVVLVAILLSSSTQAQNVGIGTTTPTQKLEVAGNTFVRDSVGIGTATPKQKLDVVGNTFVRDSVGIGIAKPLYKLDVAGRILLRGDGSTFGSAGIWLNRNTPLGFFPGAFIGMRDNLNFGLFGALLSDWGLNMNVVTGNVGIGVNEPTKKLEVNGDIGAGGNINAAGNIKAEGVVDIGIELVAAYYTAPVNQNNALTYQCDCPPGKKVLSGGGGSVGNGGDSRYIIVNNTNITGGRFTIWLSNSGNRPYNVSVWAYCARIQ